MLKHKNLEAGKHYKIEKSYGCHLSQVNEFIQTSGYINQQAIKKSKFRKRTHLKGGSQFCESKGNSSNGVVIL